MPNKLKRKSTITKNSDPIRKKRTLSKVEGQNEEKVEIAELGSKDAGVVLVCGDGMSGQLGLGEDVSEKPRPAVVPEVNNIIDVVAGGMHTVCLDKSRTKLITFGCNDEGALGRDTSESGSEFIPGTLELPGRIAQVTAGDSHTAVLLSDGVVYLWGAFRDGKGPMGLFTANKIETRPQQLEMKIKILKIASGANHLAMLGSDSQVYTMGCGEQGQLGRVTQRSADRDSRQGIDHLLTPSVVQMRKKILFSDIWAGTYCTFVKQQTTGEIFTFGLNNYKQLGLDLNIPYFRPVMSKKFNSLMCSKITVGEHHAIALDSSGKVYAMGRKEYGRLGLGKDCDDAIKPTLITTLENEKCLDIACGSCASFALTTSGKLYSWGMGAALLGQGQDAEEDLLIPTIVTSKLLERHKLLRITAGGQHLVILAQTKETS